MRSLVTALCAEVSHVPPKPLHRVTRLLLLLLADAQVVELLVELLRIGQALILGDSQLAVGLVDNDFWQVLRCRSHGGLFFLEKGSFN